MINLTGALTIRRIAGRNGRFNIGRLITEIGDFAIKDASIEEYDEGRYEGIFGIERIYLANYTAGGRLVTELRARLGVISLTGIDDAPVTSPPSLDSEPDPLDETVEVATSSNSSQSILASPSPEDENVTSDDDAAMQALFGSLWPFDDPVKLDPAIDRVKFRAQRDALKAKGYRFDPVRQSWLR